MGLYAKHVFICENSRTSGDPKGCCNSKGSSTFVKKLRTLCAQAGLRGTVRINSAGCLGQCHNGPVMVIYPDDIWYHKVTEQDLDEICDSHIVQNIPVKRLILKKPE